MSAPAIARDPLIWLYSLAALVILYLMFSARKGLSDLGKGAGAVAGFAGRTLEEGAEALEYAKEWARNKIGEWGAAYLDPAAGWVELPSANRGIEELKKTAEARPDAEHRFKLANGEAWILYPLTSGEMKWLQLLLTHEETNYQGWGSINLTVDNLTDAWTLWEMNRGLPWDRTFPGLFYKIKERY